MTYHPEVDRLGRLPEGVIRKGQRQRRVSVQGGELARKRRVLVLAVRHAVGLLLGPHHRSARAIAVAVAAAVAAVVAVVVNGVGHGGALGRIAFSALRLRLRPSRRGRSGGLRLRPDVRQLVPGGNALPLSGPERALLASALLQQVDEVAEGHALLHGRHKQTVLDNAIAAPVGCEVYRDFFGAGGALEVVVAAPFREGGPPPVRERAVDQHRLVLGHVLAQKQQRGQLRGGHHVDAGRAQEGEVARESAHREVGV